jgi:hypothetical protein
MKKSTGHTPTKNNLDIRSMFLAGVPKLLQATRLSNSEKKTDEQPEEKSKGKKRKADEA